MNDWLWGALLLLTAAGVRAEADEFTVPLTTEEQVHASAAALGFCWGQDATLDAVAREHPGLAGRVGMVKGRFTAQTGGACQDLDTALEQKFERLKPGMWATLERGIRDATEEKLAESFKAVKDAAVAEEFVAEVMRRADGGVDPLAARALIDGSRAYRRNPVLQWPRWTRLWYSKGHPKGLGTDFRLRVPVAFEEKEPSATHMLRKWTQQLPGTAHALLSVAVHPYPEGATMRDMVAEMEAMPAEELAEAMVSGVKGTVRKAQWVTLFGHRALLASFEATMAQMQVQATMHTQQVMAVLPQGSVILTCSLGGPPGEAATLVARSERYAPLCEQFFGSAFVETAP